MEVIEGFTFEPIFPEYMEEIIKKCFAKNPLSGASIIHPSECVLNCEYQKYIKKILDFEVHPDDTWVITFPRCGTTWTQEMVWLLKNDLDYKKAQSTPLSTRFPWLEFQMVCSQNATLNPQKIDFLANIPSPRFFKTHMPVELLPRSLWTVKPKIIYVTRDPRDVMISYYHFHRSTFKYEGKLEEFAKPFLADQVSYAPFWKHVLGFWDKQKTESHILFNTYEEMKKDLKGTIQKTAQFLNVKINEEDLERLKDHLSFINMKNNESVNHLGIIETLKEKFKKENDENLNFIRKGEIGGWKNVLNQDILDEFAKWNERHLKGTGWSTYPWS